MGRMIWRCRDEMRGILSVASSMMARAKSRAMTQVFSRNANGVPASTGALKNSRRE